MGGAGRGGLRLADAARLGVPGGGPGGEGTHARAGLLDALRVFRRLYLALDNDSAGSEATGALLEAFGRRAVPVALDGVKDVADLGARPGGRQQFAAAIRAAAAGVRPAVPAAA